MRGAIRRALLRAFRSTALVTRREAMVVMRHEDEFYVHPLNAARLQAANPNVYVIPDPNMPANRIEYHWFWEKVDHQSLSNPGRSVG